MVSRTIDSNILTTWEVKLIGRQLDGLDLLPFLNTGAMLPHFQSFGIWPVFKDCLNKIQSGSVRWLAQAFKIYECNESGPGDL